MAVLLPQVRARFFTPDGLPLVGGKVFSYQAGTSTPLATYTDSSGLVANPNPVILDANGEADIWLGDQPYKIIVKDANDVQLSETDNVLGGASLPPEPSDDASEVAGALDFIKDSLDAEAYNQPYYFTQCANAIRAGACKIVVVDHSIGWGQASAVTNTYTQKLERQLKLLFPYCNFTVLNYSIPGGTFANFRRGPGDPSPFYPANAAAPPSNLYAGYDPWDPLFDEERSLRWPQGQHTVNAITWQEVVLNEAPDLLLFGLLYNDLNLGGSVHDAVIGNLSWLFGTYIPTFTKRPSVCLVGAHTGNEGHPSGFNPTTLSKIRASHAIQRTYTGYYGVGYLDAGRAFDRVMRGVDCFRRRWVTDRYLDRVNDSTLWLRQASFGQPAVDPVSNSGTKNVTIDSTGKHATANFMLWARKRVVTAVTIKFVIRKIAVTGADFAFVVLSGLDLNSPIGPNKLYVAFGNDVLAILMDGDTVFSIPTPTPYPLADDFDYPVMVEWDGNFVRVWAGAGATDPNVPTLEYPAAYGPGYAGIGYANGIIPPEVKMKNIVFTLGEEYPVATRPFSFPAIFGTQFAGQELLNRYDGGDTALHPSAFGYEVLYDQALQPVINAIARQVSSVAGGNGPVIKAVDADQYARGHMARGLIVMQSAAPHKVILPNTSLETIDVGWYVDVLQYGDGAVTFEAQDISVSLDAEPNALIMAQKFRISRVRCIANGGGLHRFSINNPNGHRFAESAAAGHQFHFMNCYYDGTQFIPTQDVAAIIELNGVTNAIEFYLNAGLTPGTAFVPYKVKFINDIQGGRWTPSVSLTLNAAGATMGPCLWSRDNNIITCSGLIVLNAAAAGLAQFDLTLPVASNLLAIGDVAGAAIGVGNIAASVFAVTGTDAMRIQYTALGAGNVTFTFSAQYEVLPF